MEIIILILLTFLKTTLVRWKKQSLCYLIIYRNVRCCVSLQSQLDLTFVPWFRSSSRPLSCRRFFFHNWATLKAASDEISHAREREIQISVVEKQTDEILKWFFFSFCILYYEKLIIPIWGSSYFCISKLAIKKMVDIWEFFCLFVCIFFLRFLMIDRYVHVVDDGDVFLPFLCIYFFFF